MHDQQREWPPNVRLQHLCSQLDPSTLDEKSSLEEENEFDVILDGVLAERAAQG
jgi:hypothetical protein|eukprot:SAG25_NODE_792_length_5293_cov_27.354832_5_plen_54_part_00